MSLQYSILIWSILQDACSKISDYIGGVNSTLEYWIHYWNLSDILVVIAETSSIGHTFH
jgi:hypothetical protein